MKSRIFVTIYSAIISFLLLFGCTVEKSSTEDAIPLPRGTAAFFGNQQRMDIDGNGFTYSNLVIGSGSSIDPSYIDLSGYVKTNHDGRVRIEVLSENNIPNNPAQLTIASGGGRNGVGIDFVTGDDFGTLFWIGKIGADTHSYMDYHNIHFGSLNEAGDDYSTFAVALGDGDDATPRSYVDGKFNDFPAYTPSDMADWTWTTNSGEIHLTSYIVTGGEIVVPKTINGLPVTEMCSFSGNEDITGVTIECEITTIESETFANCVNLLHVYMPDSVTTLGYDSFANCSSMNEIHISTNLTTLVGEVFYNCDSMGRFEFPASLSYVGEYTFMDCDNLDDVFFEGDAPETGSDIFSGDTLTVHIVYGRSAWPQPPALFEGQPTEYWDSNVYYGSGRYLTGMNISNGIPVLDPFDDSASSTIFFVGTDNDNGNYQSIVRYRDTAAGDWIDQTMSDRIMWYKLVDAPDMDWIRSFDIIFHTDEEDHVVGGRTEWKGTINGYGVESDTNGNFRANSISYGSTTLIETNGNYTNTLFDNVVIMLATNVALTNTLPTITNKQFTVKRIGTNAVYIESDWTIDGSTTRTLGQDLKAITVHSGTNKWYIIGETQ